MATEQDLKPYATCASRGLLALYLCMLHQTVCADEAEADRGAHNTCHLPKGNTASTLTHSAGSSNLHEGDSTRLAHNIQAFHGISGHAMRRVMVQGGW